MHGFSVWRSVLRLPAVVKDRDQAVKVAITANERRWRPSNGGPAGGPDWSQSPSERTAKHDAWRVMVVGDRSVTHAVIPADPDLLVFERPTVLAEPSALANRAYGGAWDCVMDDQELEPFQQTKPAKGEPKTAKLTDPDREPSSSEE